jgi:acetoacetate decarboxylase
MFKFDPQEHYTMPAHFGPQTDKIPSGRYHHVTNLVVSYRTDKEKLASYLPEPFEVAEDAVVSVVYACNKEVDWLAGHGYNLIGVNASVVFNGDVDHLQGFYTLVMWENLTDPILMGREVQGIPKVFADIPDHSIVNGTWRVKASHYSHGIVEMTISGLTDPTAEEIVALQNSMEGKDNWMGWKYIPRPDGVGASVSAATLFPAENTYTGVQIGTGSVTWEHLQWEQNPTQYHIVNALADLPVWEYFPAVMTTGSTNLVVEDKPVRELK